MKERSLSPSMVVVPASSFVRVYVTTFEITLRLKKKRRLENIYMQGSVISETFECCSSRLTPRHFCNYCSEG